MVLPCGASSHLSLLFFSARSSTRVSFLLLTLLYAVFMLGRDDRVLKGKDRELCLLWSALGLAVVETLSLQGIGEGAR